MTGMLSIHNTKDIKINNLNIENNHIFDDMIHIVYVDNIEIKNSKLDNIFSDAIDIDSSKNVKIENLNISNSGNDCIDFMQTTAQISNSSLSFCGDKGVSVGERSKILISNSNIYSNNIGVVSKDDSILEIQDSVFVNNITDMSAYKKNWRYGTGGSIKLNNVKYNNSKDKITADKYSKIN